MNESSSKSATCILSLSTDDLLQVTLDVHSFSSQLKGLGLEQLPGMEFVVILLMLAILQLVPLNLNRPFYSSA